MDFKTVIVGTKFRGPDAINILSHMGQGAIVHLKAEPDNEHDPNAVAVYGSGVHLGYVPRSHNASLALKLSQGVELTSRITAEAIIEKGDVKFAPKITVTWDDAEPTNEDKAAARRWARFEAEGKGAQ